MIQPNLPPVQVQAPSCEEDRRDCISEWAEQYRAELEKQSSARAAQIESLLNAGDYEAIREWLKEWESEDKASDSVRSLYREARSQLRKQRYRQRQQKLYGSIINKITSHASADELDTPSADRPTNAE
jgi:hypothetical protein